VSYERKVGDKFFPELLVIFQNKESRLLNAVGGDNIAVIETYKP
jgi:hypothetical protein